jgi:ribulose-5-phosphate 4-epimerase/fuculose-1-phosphate aldolase
MVNITGLMSTLITANHILSYHNVLDSFGHISVRNPTTNTTFFIALQLGAVKEWSRSQFIHADFFTGPAVVSGPADIGEYLIADGSPVNGTIGGYAERYIHSAILKAYPDVNAVVHSHAEDVLPYTVLKSISPEPVYHMAGFLGPQVWPLHCSITDTHQVNKCQIGISRPRTMQAIHETCSSTLHVWVMLSL